MNRSAYLTAGLAIKTLSSLSKADIILHGEANIPKGPIIFVINHFTRIETLLLPYYIYNLTSIPVRSLADAGLFKGGLRRFFDMMGVISTKDPQRDQLILRSLLTGETDWIIYPEGNMVKTKKTMSKGEFMVSSTDGGRRRPHTGAASLALRAEFLRRHLLATAERSPLETRPFLERFSLEAIEVLKGEPVSIVPVNLTYYPIRARENIASALAARFVKDIPDRMVEEIMTEGTMLLSGVDLDIRFGPPIRIDRYCTGTEVERELEVPLPAGFDAPAGLDGFLRRQSSVIMERYMTDIYDMTTVNHEHLFASFLRCHPKKKMRETDLKRRVFLAATRLTDREKAGCYLHRSILEDQIHLLIDDRFGKYRNFLDLALEKGALREENGMLLKERSRLADLVSFHRSRIDNPIEVIANEVEPLKKLQRLISSLAWRPDFLVKFSIVHLLLQKELARFHQDFAAHAAADTAREKSRAPFLLQGATRRAGVVLVHSYLANPEEVRQLAEYLSRRGIWVYVPRLAGHGTSPDSLAETTYGEWLEAVEAGYAIISNICQKVILGGISVGGCLAFELAARVKKIAGIFAVCPPSALHDFSTEFMPNIDVWNRIVAKVKGNSLEDRFLTFSPDDREMTYDRNPVFGVREVGRLLDSLRPKLEEIRHPALVVQASDNPVVDQKGSRQFFDRLGSRKKHYCLVDSKRHIIVNGEGAGTVHRLIENFIRDLI